MDKIMMKVQTLSLQKTIIPTGSSHYTTVMMDQWVDTTYYYIIIAPQRHHIHMKPVTYYHNHKLLFLFKLTKETE